MDFGMELHFDFALEARSQRVDLVMIEPGVYANDDPLQMIDPSTTAVRGFVEKFGLDALFDNRESTADDLIVVPFVSNAARGNDPFAIPPVVAASGSPFERVAA